MNQELRNKIKTAVAKRLHDDDARAFKTTVAPWESLRPGDYNYECYMEEAERIMEVVEDVWKGQ